MAHRPVFIVSTGRSGSTMVARALGLHPKTCALHEPKPTLHVEAWSHWKGKHSLEKIRMNLENKRNWLVEQIQGQGLLYIESSHFLSHLIPILRELYDPRFIHLHRNGADFVRSGLGKGWYLPDYGGDSAIKRWIRRTFLVDIGTSHEDHKLEPPAELDDRFEKSCWLWREINEVIVEGLVSVAEEDRMGVSLDSFNTGEGFRRVLEFVGVEFGDELVEEMTSIAQSKPNKTPRRDNPSPEEWSRDRWKTLDRIAGDMMLELGYETKRESATNRARATR